MLDRPLPPEPLYLPFEAGPYRMSMGLVAREPDELISLDLNYPAEIEARRRILAEHATEVVAAVPGAEGACAEMLERLAEVLPRRYPGCFERQGEVLYNHITGERWTLD